MSVPIPYGTEHPATTVDEPADPYLRLLAAARQVAARIVETPGDGLTGAAGYLRRASEELLAAVPSSDRDALASEGAIFEGLRRVAEAWPDIAAGTIDGERVFSEEPGLWKRAMTEWPMGGFARMTADFLMRHGLLSGGVVELGAGVGSCSALVAGEVTDRFVRTDLQPFLLRRQKIAGTVERYDFDEPARWRDLDTVFAVNAVHCARDKVATLRYLFDALRHGGVLVLGEGQPHTDARRTPWALNLFLGPLRGWWDRGGFLERDDWFVAMKQAGFSDIGFAARRAGVHDLGGVIWAVK